MEDYNNTPPVQGPPPPPLSSNVLSQEEDIPPLKPNNWLWQSIVATLFCCNVLGIVGIVYAARVDVLYSNRKYSEAEKNAKNARTWTIIAIVLGLISIISWVVMMSTGNMPSYLEEIIENNASGYNF
ncbi:MAG: CD225/dispanin family protein [Fermentimonas sp.]|nr:CD225/dispanin family protein [Fermentimonas sp.]